MKILEHMVATPLAQAVGWTLLHSLWQGAAIAAGLGAVVLSTRSARVRYAAASLAMLAVVICAGFTLIHVMPNSGNASAVSNALGPRIAGSVDVDFDHSHFKFAAAIPWLAPFWMAGVWIVALRQMMGWVWASRLRRRGVCSVPDSGNSR